MFAPIWNEMATGMANTRLLICRLISMGLWILTHIRQAITPQTILISIMAANNEIGTIAPSLRLAHWLPKRAFCFIQTRRKLAVIFL